LPGASRYNAALVNNEEYAKQIAQQPESDEPWSPSQAEFGLNEHLLTVISDQIQALTILTSKVNGGKPGEVKPQPRPKSAIEEAKKQAELEWARGFIQRLGFPADAI